MLLLVIGQNLVRLMEQIRIKHKKLEIPEVIIKIKWMHRIGVPLTLVADIVEHIVDMVVEQVVWFVVVVQLSCLPLTTEVEQQVDCLTA